MQQSVSPPSPEAVDAIARAMAEQLARQPQVQAVTRSGSRAAGTADARSDLDLYVYARAPLDPGIRTRIVMPRARRAEIDNRYWEVEDVWIEADSGLKVELIHRESAWTEEHLRDLLEGYKAQLGYTTAIWHNVLSAEVLAERDAWFTSLQERARVPYPDGLVAAILGLNLPLLQGSLVAYPEQLRVAAARGDLVSVQHRATALLASYFDVLYAINRAPHPGEKRLLADAARLARVPRGMREDVEAILDTSNPDRVLAGVDGLLAHLGDFLQALGHEGSERRRN